MSEEINEHIQSFAELLEESGTKRSFFKPGERLLAKVVKITQEWVFIDLGEKNEGYLERKELQNSEGCLLVQEGETIPVYFLKSENHEKRFTTRITSTAAGKNFLADAWRNGIPVEGRAEKEVKGGFEIKLSGGVRGFCPFSQLTLRRGEDPASLLNQTLIFRIVGYGEDGRNIVLSRRLILEEEEAAKKEVLKGLLKEGDSVSGRVVGLEKFGAFVDLGGVQGLIPTSELGWDRSKGAADVLSLGQEINVAILKLDWEKDRISLSIKSTLNDPWHTAEEKYLPGSTHPGTVTRLAEFGAFVTLEAGIDGLLHISKLGRGKRIKHPREVLQEGEALDVQIENVQKDVRRISLNLPELAQPKEEDTTKEYREQAVKSMGTLGDLWNSKAKSTKDDKIPGKSPHR